MLKLLRIRVFLESITGKSQIFKSVFFAIYVITKRCQSSNFFVVFYLTFYFYTKKKKKNSYVIAVYFSINCSIFVSFGVYRFGFNQGFLV